MERRYLRSNTLCRLQYNYFDNHLKLVSRYDDVLRTLYYLSRQSGDFNSQLFVHPSEFTNFHGCIPFVVRDIQGSHYLPYSNESRGVRIMDGEVIWFYNHHLIDIQPERSWDEQLATYLYTENESDFVGVSL